VQYGDESGSVTEMIEDVRIKTLEVLYLLCKERFQTRHLPNQVTD
jgi:hypothetical protein